jgi:tetratricopeptide (TPR) repeat protein
MKQSDVIICCLVAFLIAVFSSVSSAAESDTFRIAQGSAPNRVALVISNATYPDDDRPLGQPIRDARAVADELRRADFEVVTGEDVTKQKLRALLGSFKAKIRQGSTALVFFSGYGIQSGKQSYIIPVDAQIWAEGEVKRDGISIESILSDINAAGATVKLVIVDAARRNPFERRFRGLSTGLAPLTAPAGTLAIYSAAPDKAVNDADGANSLFVTELLKEMRAPGQNAEAIFNSTQKGVSRGSKGEQVPWVSSSLVDDFYFGKAMAAAPPAGSSPPPPPAASPPAPPRTASSHAPPSVASSRPHASPPAAATASPPAPSPPVQPTDTTPSSPSQLASRPTTPPPAATEDDPSLSELNDAIERNPRDADLYYKRGQVFAEKQKFALATEDFGRAIQLNPNDTEALNNRCFTRAVLGQLDAALTDCTAALRLRPKYVDALDSRGLTHLKLTQLDRAIADFDAALRLNPKLASALYGRGKAKIMKGDTAGGNADIRAAKAINSGIDREFESYGVP